MNKFIVALFVACGVSGCTVQPIETSSCPGDSFECGKYCCPNEHYACSAGQCVLTSCDAGFQMCGRSCIPLSAPCCNQAAGLYCPTGSQCCGAGCVPLFSVCCPATSTYCGVGRVCCGMYCC